VDPACEASDLLVAFLNTRPIGGARDTLHDWLARRAGEPIDRADVAAGEEFRANLLVLLRASPSSAAAASYLNRVANRYPLVLIISAEGGRVGPAQSGVPGVFGALLAAITDLTYRGIWARVKVCHNVGCHRAFFDKTRNTSGLYCGPACSAQASTRAYRNRQKVA
jgi:predicted RNA-binding Zn ribbon-like protein